MVAFSVRKLILKLILVVATVAATSGTPFRTHKSVNEAAVSKIETVHQEANAAIGRPVSSEVDTSCKSAFALEKSKGGSLAQANNDFRSDELLTSLAISCGHHIVAPVITD